LTTRSFSRCFDRVATDIRRRIKNYGASQEPAALLDGITFAARAKRVNSDLLVCSAGEYFSEHKWGLGLAKETLTDRLTDLSLNDLDEDALEGIDLDA